jgi:hypothetical protein
LITYDPLAAPFFPAVRTERVGLTWKT